MAGLFVFMYVQFLTIYLAHCSAQLLRRTIPFFAITFLMDIRGISNVQPLYTMQSHTLLYKSFGTCAVLLVWERHLETESPC